MTTVTFKGRVYAVCADVDYEDTACSRCVFRDDPDHACASEGWEGEYDEGPALSCIAGKHHYGELPQ